MLTGYVHVFKFGGFKSSMHIHKCKSACVEMSFVAGRVVCFFEQDDNAPASNTCVGIC